MKKSTQIVLFIFLLTLIILLILANLFLPQVYGLLFSVPEKTGELSVTPVLVDGSENIYKVDIKFKSGDDVDVAKPVSAVTFSLSYPKDDSLSIQVIDTQGNPTNEVQVGPIVSSDQWEVPINRIIETKEGVEIEFAAVNVTPSGFTSSNFVTLGSIYFKTDKPLDEDTFVLTFNTDESAIVSKIKPTKDILDGEGRLYYSVD